MMDMAIPTGSFGVLTIQFECGQVVIECRRCPVVGSMAGMAISAKMALVHIFRRMAGAAVLRGGLEVCKGARIDMALRALNLGMFSSQLERCAVMVEIVTIGIHPIVAGQAINPKIQDVSLLEDLVHLEVAGCADVLVETVVDLRMAIVTAEG
jgi:hypothetical protein